MTIVRRAFALVFRLAEIGLVGVAVLLCGAVGWAVISRYVLNESVLWADELPSLALIWLSFLGAAVLAYRDENLSFDGLSAAMPARLQRIMEAFNAVLILSFLGILVYHGWRLTTLTWSREAVTLPVSMGLVRLVVPLSGALMMAVYARRLARAIRGPVPTRPERTP